MKPLILSTFENISQKLSFIAQIIKSKSDADQTQCYVHCELVDGLETMRVGTLGDTHIWTYLPIYHRKSGPMFTKSFSVNLFDFQSVLNGCTDDIASLYLDEYDDDGKSAMDLVINSFYNDDNEWYELAVRLNATIIESVPSIEITEPKLADFSISSLGSYTLANYYNTIPFENILIDLVKTEFKDENETPLVTMDISGVLDTFTMTLTPKDKITHYIYDESLENVKVNLSTSIFRMMTSTGQITNNNISIFTNGYAFCKTKDFGFYIPNSISDRDLVVINEGSYDGIVVNSEVANISLNTLDGINTSSDNKVLTIEKINKTNSDFSVENNNRLWACIRVECEVLTDDVFETSLLGIKTMFKLANCPELKVKHDNEGNSTIFFENGWSSIKSKFNKTFGSSKKEV